MNLVIADARFGSIATASNIPEDCYFILGAKSNVDTDCYKGEASKEIGEAQMEECLLQGELLLLLHVQ